MTFAEICKMHQAGKNLEFKHPHLSGVMCFDEDGQLLFFDVHGRNVNPPLWLSDFDRDDWEILGWVTRSADIPHGAVVADEIGGDE